MEVYRQHNLQWYRICLNFKNEISSQHFVFCEKLSGERRIWAQCSIFQSIWTHYVFQVCWQSDEWSLLHIVSSAGYTWLFFFSQIIQSTSSWLNIHWAKHYCSIKKPWHKNNHLEIRDISELSWLMISFLFCFPLRAEKSLLYPEHPGEHWALITQDGNNEDLRPLTLLAQKNSVSRAKNKE